jgi:hypothetical protein
MTYIYSRILEFFRIAGRQYWIALILSGAYLFYESTLYAALLKNNDAGKFYPLCTAILLLSDELRCPYVFWIIYPSFPFLGLALFVLGCRGLCRRLQLF